MKKLIAGILGFVLCFNLGITAFASDGSVEVEYLSEEDLLFEYTVDSTQIPIEELDGQENLLSFSLKEDEWDFVIEDVEEFDLPESDEPAVYASGVDLAVRDMYVEAPEPFFAGDYVSFLVIVENRGDEDAANVPLSININGTTIGTHSCGTVKAMTGQKIAVGLKSNNPGTHKVAFIINETGAIEETNYENNYVSQNYRWIGHNGICAYEFESADGKSSFPVVAPKVYNYAVANFGTEAVNDVTVGYMVNQKISYTWEIAQIEPGYAVTGTIKIGFATPGRRNIGIMVDPNQEIPDAFRADNFKIVTAYVVDGEMIRGDVDGSIRIHSNDNGWVTFYFEGEWNEYYSISEGKAYFYKRQGYITAASNVEPTHLSQDVSVRSENHTNRSNNSKTFLNMTEYDAYFPNRVYYEYAKENNEIFVYSINNNMESGFTYAVVDTGGGLWPAGSKTFAIDLNVE